MHKWISREKKISFVYLYTVQSHVREPGRYSWGACSTPIRLPYSAFRLNEEDLGVEAEMSSLSVNRALKKYVIVDSHTASPTGLQYPKLREYNYYLGNATKLGSSPPALVPTTHSWGGKFTLLDLLLRLWVNSQNAVSCFMGYVLSAFVQNDRASFPSDRRTASSQPVIKI
jgi:hypothetical protein